MPTTRIPAVLDELAAEESELQARLDKSKQLTKTIENELTQVRKAIALLRPRTPATQSNGKPTASKHEILQITTELLEQGARPEEELKKLVENAVASTGKSLTGFAMRFKNVLKDARFSNTGDAIQLATPTQLQAN